MDITCTRCGEPWDNDTIHEEVALRVEAGETATYQSVAAEFRSKGCVAFREFTGRSTPCERRRNARTSAASALADLLGDDMDGAAAMMEDAEFLGLLEDES